MTKQTNKSTNKPSLKIDNVRENDNTRGYCCDFYIGKKKFYADVSRVQYCGPECMIFRYNKDNKFIDWSGVYTDRDVGVNEESLLKCIRDFAEQYEP